MCAFVQANTNGRLHDAAEPSISPLNRGFLYGDAIYEVWRTYEGVLFAWEEHWARLQRSAQALYFEIPFTPDVILTEIKKTVAAFRKHTKSAAEVYVRLQLSRGEGAIGLDTAFAERASYVLLVQENKLYSAAKFEEGLTLSIARDLKRNAPDALNPAWKTGNYLNNILCLREARARGADEVVICNLRGEITEAAVSNIAFVKDGAVITPPLSAGILAGITRQILIEKVAPAAGVSVREETVSPSELPSMTEAFILSTTKDITPIRRIDDVNFKIGSGTTTLKLKAAFGNYVKDYIERHSYLHVGS
ncbi:MAG TPA: aminotransferase class IV [Opitutaceae bacterium]|nr:aminotransferase class IV [Opitutaceae bacterium]